MDVVIVRENEEDLYAGIEHQQTPDVMQCLKLISRPGSEKIVRYAFEYARKYSRKKVTCFTKDNIMKMTDGLFHEVFDEIGARISRHRERSTGSSTSARPKWPTRPKTSTSSSCPTCTATSLRTSAAQIAGSVGLAGSANIGDHSAMFEAIHGSAPRRAGQNLANPSGLLHGAIMMLVHIGQHETATLVHNAWLKTIEDGIHTYDIARGGPSVGTKEFAQAVVERLGEQPKQLQAVDYGKGAAQNDGRPPMREPMPLTISRGYQPKRELNGVDVYMYNVELSPDELGRRLEELAGPEFKLTVISNRGVKVYPEDSRRRSCRTTGAADSRRPSRARPPAPASARCWRARTTPASSGSSWTTCTCSTASWPTRWTRVSKPSCPGLPRLVRRRAPRARAASIRGSPRGASEGPPRAEGPPRVNRPRGRPGRTVHGAAASKPSGAVPHGPTRPSGRPVPLQGRRPSPARAR